MSATRAATLICWGAARGDLAVIGRHVAIDPDKVQIKMDRGKSVSTLAVDIEIPNRDQMSGAAARFNR